MTGSIIKRGNTYTVVLYDGRDADGKKRYKWFAAGTKRKAAEDKLQELLDEQKRGVRVDGKMTVAIWLRQWISDCCKTQSPGTLENYTNVVEKTIIPELGHIKLRDLHPSHVQKAYTKWLEEYKRSAVTVGNYHRVMMQAFAQAVRWQMLLQNPVAAVKPPVVRKEKIMRAISFEKATTLLAALADTRLLVPATISLFGGLRRGEVLALRWSEVDLQSGHVRVCRSLEQTKTGLRVKEVKNRKARELTLPPHAMAAMRAHKAAQNVLKMRLRRDWQENDLVCPDHKGQLWVPDNFTKAWTSKVDRAGHKGVRFHDLRHTFGSWLWDAKVDMATISRRMGHSSVAVTDGIYTHELEGKTALVADQFQEWISKGLAKHAKGGK